MQVRVDRTVEGFSARAEEIKAFKANVTCRPDFGQTDLYPYLAFSFPGGQSEACDKISALVKEFPDFGTHLLMAKPHLVPEIDVVLSAEYRFTKPAPLDHESLIVFVRDYSHQTFARWPLSESHQITLRRFGFIVYAKEYRARPAETLAYARGDFVCLGMQNLTEFILDNPNVELTDQNLPALALTNQDQSRFMLVRNVKFGDDLSTQITDWLREPDHPEMIFPYRYYTNALQTASIEQDYPNMTSHSRYSANPIQTVSSEQGHLTMASPSNSAAEPVQSASLKPIEEPQSNLLVILLFAFILLVVVVCGTARRRLRKILKPLRASVLLNWLPFTLKDPTALD